MKLIGYWANRYDDDGFCFPQEIVGPLPDDVRTRVAEYLDSGLYYDSYRGTSYCRFCIGPEYELGSKQVGSAELTDGEWVWPEGLSHYVRDHGIILPDEFIVRASTAPFPRPTGDIWAYLESLGLRGAGKFSAWQSQRQWPEASLDYWRAWCQAHRSPEIKKSFATQPTDFRKKTTNCVSQQRSNAPS